MKPPTPVIHERLHSWMLKPDYARLKACCETHGVTLQEIIRDAVLAYLGYLENGQWAMTVPAMLIQPTIEAARSAGLSLSDWMETCIRQSLQRPPDPVYKKGRPVKEHPENVTIFCRCGCGTALKKYDSVWRERKYLNGHQPKSGKWLVWNRTKRKDRTEPPVKP